MSLWAEIGWVAARFSSMLPNCSSQRIMPPNCSAETSAFIIPSMAPPLREGQLPLPALLSQALVAFTIEFDNEFEHRTPHRTTDYGSTPGAVNPPWLVSMVMWTKYLRHIPGDGVTVSELQLLTRSGPKELQQWLTRLAQWWGYLRIERSPASGPPKRLQPDAIVRPTPGGQKALEVWRPLTEIIEGRWQQRFGRELIEALRQSLTSVVSQLDPALPGSLPILGYGLSSSEPEAGMRTLPTASPLETSLPALFSKLLLAFAIEFERESPLSLAIAANVLRLAGEPLVPIKDLPRLSGVSKAAIAMAVSFLEKRGYAVAKPELPGSRVKLLVLTTKGLEAHDACGQLIWAIEERWRHGFGSDKLQRVRELLEPLIGEPNVRPSSLMSGLQPCPGCWRASLPAPETLPHYPMILHRGGYPDGS